MKFPGGNPLMFCEQVGTVTSLFEQWNDCERTVVLYALLKRVPFANLKFLQLSIDYNLAQNYSSQSKLQLLETHANSANFLNKLVQQYQTTTCCGSSVGASISLASSTLSNNDKSCINSSSKILTISDSGYDSEKKNSAFDLSSTSSSSCSSTSGISCGSISSQATSMSSSLSSSALKLDTAKPGQQKHESSKSNSSSKLVETKKDILNDMLTYLPLLKPGNDDVKSVYMSLIPAAVEDACQQTVPTELVQHILSYLLIHPAINNDDRRSLSYWLRHLEEHIATSYAPTTHVSPTVAATTNNSSNNNINTNKLINNNNSNTNNNNNNSSYFALPPATNAPTMSQPSHVGGPNNNLAVENSKIAAGDSSGQQSLQLLTASSWQFIQQKQQQQQQQQRSHLHQSSSGSCNQLSQPPPPLPSSVSVSNSSLRSKSQQSLSQASSSISNSNSCLESASSQMLRAKNMLSKLDWAKDVPGGKDGGGGAGAGRSGECTGSINIRDVGSMENVTIKEFAPVTFNFPSSSGNNKSIGSSNNANMGSSNTNKHHHLIMSSSQTQSILGNSVNSGPDGNLNLNGGNSMGHPVVLTDLDSSDDNHLSFSKNGTEIFDYDCDYDNEEEYNYLARAAAAVATGAPSISSNSTTGGNIAAGSAVTVGTNTGGGSVISTSSGYSKNRVSFDANIGDFLRVPPIGVGEFDLDGNGVLKTRRSNSLTTTVSSTCGLPVAELHQQKQNNECLSAENLSNLSNLQLLQIKPRSFSLTMETPRSTLTSSGSETRLDDFKQKQLGKMYGQSSNVGMSTIALWLKSLRLHKYVWIFSNLTYDQMLEISEDYLENLGVTKGARHKLVICIQKLKERYATLVQLEKEVFTSANNSNGSPKSQICAVLDEMNNIVLTPMKPLGQDGSEDIAEQFFKVMEMVAAMVLPRTGCLYQEEECLGLFTWLVDRALHNDAFVSNSMLLKDYKYKSNRIKTQIAPKSHYAKNATMNGNISKPRWTVANKHKSGGSVEGGPKTAHRKSSLQYFSSPMQQTQSSQQQQQASTSTTSSSLLQAIPQQFFNHSHNSSSAANYNSSYNKSSSYPSFAGNMSNTPATSSKTSTGGSSAKHSSQVTPQGQGQGQGQKQHQQPQKQAHLSQQTSAPQGNFMYHRHSLNNISTQQQQQFIQQLQGQQQQPLSAQLVPSIFLTTMGSSNAGSGTSSAASNSSSNNTAAKISKPQHPREVTSQKETAQNFTAQSNDLLASKSQNNSIGDINSRLEFLCLQMTEQAIN